MATITQIEAKILELDGGSYQALMNAYLYAKYKFQNISKLGSQVGTAKPTKGIPDAYVKLDTDHYAYIMYGTVQSANPFQKIKKDILSVLNNKKSKIPYDKITKLICCHTSSDLTPDQDAALYALTNKLELLGINTVASDLFYHYQFLAHSHLGLAIDTNQILSLEEFIKQYNAKESTPLDFKILGREKEKKELFDLLKSYDIITITGPSGVGKTKFAIEVAQEFANKHSYVLKVLLNKGDPLFEDISAHFTDDNDFLVVLDDANLVSQINHFLDLIISPDRKHKTKLILTVRDYANDSLSSRIYPTIHLASFPLPPLERNVLDNIIKTNFKIYNPLVLDKIFTMTHHNVRLSIMAAQCIHQKEWEKIQDASELFDLYYKNESQSLSSEEIIVATLIAFFDRVSLNKNEFIVKMLDKLSITYEQFTQIVKSLYQKELVNLLRVEAVKFEDQTFRDYLLYRYLAANPIIPIEELLNTTLPQYIHNVISIYNVVGNIFHKEEVLSPLISALKNYWKAIYSAPIEEKITFLEAFHVALPTETFDFADEIFQNGNLEKQNKGIITSLLKMLVQYKNTTYLENALGLLLSYLQHSVADVPFVCSLFKDNLYIDEYSSALKYEKEILILKILYQEFKKQKNINCGILLVSFAETCLQTQTTVHTSYGRKILLTTIYLDYCKEAIYLRKLAFKYLGYAFTFTPLKAEVRKSLFNKDTSTPKHPFSKTDQLNLVNFITRLDIRRFDDALLLGILYMRCKRHHIHNLEPFIKYRKNKFVQIFLELSGYFRRELIPYQEAHKIQIQKLKQLTRNFTKNDFRKFLKTLLSSKLALQINPNSLNQSIGTLFESQEDKQQFSALFGAYAELLGDLSAVYLPYIFSSAIYRFNNQFLSKLISKFRNKKKEIFLSALYTCAPIKELEQAKIDQILQVPMQKKNNFHCYLLSMRRIIEINNKFPTFTFMYIKQVYDFYPNNCLVWSYIFNDIITFKEKEVTTLVHTLMPKHNTKMLQKIYLLLASTTRHTCFDYEGILFNEIYKQNKNFMDLIIQEALIKNNNIHLTDIYEIIWRLKEHRNIIEHLINSLYHNETEKIKIISTLRDILFPFDTHAVQAHRADFVKSYIIRHAKNMQRMTDLFDSMQGQSLADRTDFILAFCRKNSLFENFQQIKLQVNFRCWSGSLLPILDKDIQALSQLQNKLTGSKYYRHRAILRRAIDSLSNEKKRVEKEEFLDTF